MAQRRKPVETGALGVFTRGEQQIRGEIVVDIFTVDGVLDVNRTLTITERCRNGGQERPSNSHEVCSPWNQKCCKGGEQAQVDGRAKQSHGVGLELWAGTVMLQE